MKNEPIEKEKVAIVESALFAYLSNDKKSHLLFCRSEVTKDFELNNKYIFHLENQRHNREISISFRPGNSQEGFFGVAIRNKEEKGRFSLHDYFVAHKKELKEIDEHFGSRKNDEDFSLFVDRFFKTLFSIFNTSLEEIIIGNKWENVPFDWRGYK